MEKFIVEGPTKLVGNVSIAGAKNVALKALVASLLTREPVTLRNIPAIGDVALMIDVLTSLGKNVRREDHVVTITEDKPLSSTVPLDLGARLRASSMVVGPLLARTKQVKIPNPGGCRIGARPIDRHIEGLKNMGASVVYHPEDGYFWITTEQLRGGDVTFPKNTHTGTETILLAACLSTGKTTIHNAALEVEVDDLINMIRLMGGSITRSENRTIEIEGVETLHGCDFTIMPDRNEEVTFAIAAVVSGGSITVSHSQRSLIEAFLTPFRRVGCGIEEIDETTTRYFWKGPIHAMDIETAPHPGFMTDWQAPWALLMVTAEGTSVIHETVFESRFHYATELMKMGTHIEFFHPVVTQPETYYNFNWEDHDPDAAQAIRITGPNVLHNAVLTMNDLRAGATLLLATIIARGESTIFGIDQIDRGYEHIESRLCALGAKIRREDAD